MTWGEIAVLVCLLVALLGLAALVAALRDVREEPVRFQVRRRLEIEGLGGNDERRSGKGS